MRASRILAARPESAAAALSQLIEERPEGLNSAAPSSAAPQGAKLSSLPPQTPYTVGSTSRPLVPQGLSPKPDFFEHSKAVPVAIRPPPDHMAPKRSAWTSPPPPEAPPEAKTTFEQMLEGGIELATASTEAREAARASFSSSASEISTDDDRRSEAAESEDDVHSVQSFTEGTSSLPASHRRPSAPAGRSQQAFSAGEEHPGTRLLPAIRGRIAARLADNKTPIQSPRPRVDTIVPSSTEAMRRTQSHSATIRPPQHRFSWAGTQLALPLVTPLPPSPVTRSPSSRTAPIDSSSVFYETSPARYPPSPAFYSYAIRSGIPAFAYNALYTTPSPTDSPSPRSEDRPPPSPLREVMNNLRAYSPSDFAPHPDTPTPSSSSHRNSSQAMHSHSHSTATITAAHFVHLAKSHGRTSRSPSRSRSPRVRSPTRSPSPSRSHDLASSSVPSPLRAEATIRGEALRGHRVSASTESTSPTPSSAGYYSSLPASPSPSPPSTSPPSPSLLKENFATKFEPVQEVDEVPSNPVSASGSEGYATPSTDPADTSR